MNKQKLHLLLSVLWFIFLLTNPLLLHSQTEYKVIGSTNSYTYTVPAGVTQLKVECWGGGGGGSEAYTTFLWIGQTLGGGGGGGAYASSLLTVTPTATYSITVGTGGTGNNNGNNSSFATLLVAAGGKGTSNAIGGAGGSKSTSPAGVISFAGGNGANGSGGNSGGGGGGASATSAGGNAQGIAPGLGILPHGGNGGSGVSGNNNGNAGLDYGGGGSGAKYDGFLGSRTGGSGANGLVIVTPIINKWKGTTSSNWDTPSNWTDNTIPPEDANIIFDDAVVNHCVMNANHSVNNITNAQSTYRLVTNGKKLTVKGSLQFSNGAQMDARASNSTIEFTGQTTQTIPSGSFYNNQVNNLVVNNSNNVILNGTIRLLNTISSVNGRFDASTLTELIYEGVAQQSIESNVFLLEKAEKFTINNNNGVNFNANNFTINNSLTVSSGKITIMPDKALKVLGTITNSVGTSGILIKSSSTLSNGSLVFNDSNPILATVELYSKSSWDENQPAGSKYNWQYFGIPVKTIKASPTFDGAYVRKKIETGTNTANHWEQLNNNSLLEAFVGYEICQQTPTTYTIEGELVNTNFQSGQLSKTSGALYPGQHLFTNSYTAAIDIPEIDFGSDMEATAYLYNTGTFNEWGDGSGTSSLPGQYLAAPRLIAGSLGIPRQVPSMGTMLVRVHSATPNAYLNFSYNSATMRNNLPMRSKSKVQQDTKPNTSTTIEVQGEKSGDKLWLFYDNIYTRGFDNGYDGKKILGSALNCQIFAVESDGNYQINSIPDADNTVIAFQAGADSVFTLTFNHENLQERYSNLYLFDTVKNKIVDITDSGSTYTFSALSTPQPVNRFKIISNVTDKQETNKTKIIHFTENRAIRLNSFSNESGSVQLYDIAGRLISSSTIAPLGSDLIALKPLQIYLLKITNEGETFVNKVIVR